MSFCQSPLLCVQVKKDHSLECKCNILLIMEVRTHFRVYPGLSRPLGPKSHEVTGTSHREGGLYILDQLKTPKISAAVPSVDVSGCKLAKFSALPFPKINSFSVAPFDLIHLMFGDPLMFLQRGLSCDLGGEYTSHAFKELLVLGGKIYQTSCTDTPEQNRVVERKHMHILETAGSFLLSPSGPSEFWGEAALTFRSKLTSLSAICVFLGYGVGQKGYRCFDPISRAGHPDSPTGPSTTVTTQSSSETANTTEHRYPPSSFNEAVLDPLWQRDMAKELIALHQTHTWDLVSLPAGKRAIGSRWVYKIKTKADGSIKRYKARLVAKGYSQ
ncbi:uncharacterized protein LOC126657069 [Mercurialis annua]|uniref:uncharacterized protein LOC126657069 n=1 Tax=Mercurialis annua TaxID=3986 RepID=UPI0021609603|nr:uncharacterized protein LOC126657069 [Mercurialis annua]